MSLRDGGIVEINLDSSLERASSLKAQVYEISEHRLILSQTSPPLRSAYIDKTLYLSYVSKQKVPAQRHGFLAKLKKLSLDYELAVGNRVPALILEMLGKPKQMSLRKCFRIHKPKDSGLSLTLGDKECEIADISLSGIRFVPPVSLNPLDAGHHIEFRLRIDGHSLCVEAKVIRVSRSSTVTHVSALFLSPERELQPVLSKKILMLERKQLSRGF